MALALKGEFWGESTWKNGVCARWYVKRLPRRERGRHNRTEFQMDGQKAVSRRRPMTRVSSMALLPEGSMMYWTSGLMDMKGVSWSL